MEISHARRWQILLIESLMLMGLLLKPSIIMDNGKIENAYGRYLQSGVNLKHIKQITVDIITEHIK
jgi:hypothetical protein